MAEVLDPAEWARANGAFLAASVAWVRLLLRRHAPQPDLPTPPASSTALEPSRRWFGGRRPDAALAVLADVREPPLHVKVTDDDIVAAAAAVTAAEAVTPPPALVSMAARFGLTRFERNILLLCAAVELDPAVGALCAAAQGSEQMRYPTFALALGVLPDPAWAAVSPERGLRYWRLVEIHQPAGRPMTTSALGADERIVNHIKGLDYLDDRLAPLMGELPPVAGATLPPSQEQVVEEAALAWSASGEPPVVQLLGTAAASKQLAARRTAASFGLALYRLPTELLPSGPAELDSLARLWEREARLAPVALYLDGEDADTTGPGAPPVAEFLGRLSAPAFLATREGLPGLARWTVLLEVAAPTTAERAEAWRTALGPDHEPVQIERLASQFALDTPAIAAIAAGTPSGGLWSACVARCRPRLEGLAQRLRPVAGWADIVLPDDELRVLHQIADQVRARTRVHDDWGFAEGTTRGLGLAVLFTGPSGCGKTLAAEVLATDLELDLYRTDLAGVVNKYIGETEKNLRQLFDAAEDSGAILFIDEAEALLGKRSEVRDAHDRYANIQVDYLLQRMEAYRGLAIMATNMRSAVDHAALRRIRLGVEFPFPGPEQRRLIWQRAFPERVPGAHDLDFDRLARLSVTGGMVRNIALNAAFAAAAAGSSVSMPRVLGAARDEFRKLQLPLHEPDFAWTAP